MNSIIEFLESNRYTALEISYGIDCTPGEVINRLMDLETRGMVGQLNGYWFNITQNVNAFDRFKKPVNIRLFEVINAVGITSKSELSCLTDYSLFTITSALKELINNGDVIKFKKDGIYLYGANPKRTPNI